MSDKPADVANRPEAAALGLWDCHGGANQRWRVSGALELTYEENVDRDGETIAQFNLAAADARLCQQSCAENRQCTGWLYRKPDGRSDGNPHCWLRKNLKGEKTDRLNISGRVRPEARP